MVGENGCFERLRVGGLETRGGAIFGRQTLGAKARVCVLLATLIKFAKSRDLDIDRMCRGEALDLQEQRRNGLFDV